MKNALLTVCLMSFPFFVSCNGPVLNPIGNGTARNVIEAKNDSEIWYDGKTVVDQSKLLPLIRDSFTELDGDRLPIYEIDELSVLVDQATTMKFAKEIAFELQVAGHDVAIASDEKKIVMPPMGRQATDFPDVLLTVKLSADPSGHLASSELLVKNESVAEPAVDVKLGVSESAKKIAQAVKQWLAKTKTKKVEIEFAFPQNLLAEEAVTIYSAVTEIAAEQNPMIKFWPFGFPREEQPALDMQFDEPAAETPPDLKERD